jgi:hypothetical protein
MKKRAFLGITAVALLAMSASDGFSRTQTGQNRVPQEVVINGQRVTAATVTTAQGQIQSFTCSSPQHYVTPDGSQQGWACYEQTTGVWLMNAVPPVQPAQSVPAPTASAPAPVPAPLPGQAPPPVYQRTAPAYPQSAPAVIYPQVPAVVYQSPVIYPQPTVIYQQPAVIYQQPAIVYAAPAPVVYAPVYSPGVVLGAAAIGAAGRIASAAIFSSRYPAYYPIRAPFFAPVRVRGWR